MKCQRPGCSGNIVDGYCDVCGMAPERREWVSAASPKTADPAAPSGTTGGSAPATTGGSAAAGTGTTSSRATTSGRSRRGTRSRLGAGLVEIPPVPFRDPGEAIMADPSVPESRRFCSRCGEPVGRGRDGKPGRPDGFCRKCGAPFAFQPKLVAGDLVARQYEIAGCLAHGGLGWIYLAKDRNVSDRWVVLKGLLNTGDEDAMAAALAERRFLAEVEHPNIVKIFNFVQHRSDGYIVMEYVGGRSLKQILTARREEAAGQPSPLPAAQAIAYMLEVLPALGHLHETGLVFCDFKIDNVIQTRHSLKLIDLGGVHRLDDPSGAVFGTAGYQAPEIAAAGPSVSSDLFTVARTLAVLSIDFRGYQSTYQYTLPPRGQVPLFERYDSLYRALLRATDADPEARFQSAEEMADQLYGVLREVVAAEEGRAVPAVSSSFTGPAATGSDGASWRALPRPAVASDDPGAAYLATVSATDPGQLIAQLRAAPTMTVEVKLRLAAAMIDAGSYKDAFELLSEVTAEDAWDWRPLWYRGVAELARERPGEARGYLFDVYRALPGELAPKLALGLACEGAGEGADAAGWYDVVSRTDPGFTSAAFGLARCRLAAGDRPGALAAYERVPDSSSAYIDAQTAEVRCAASGASTASELAAAGTRLSGLQVEEGVRERLAAELLEAALGLAVAGTLGSSGASLLGRRLEEIDLRLGLEECYRSLASRAPLRADRIRLVDRANAVRPRTWT
jgi:serine/threonine-protein kinase PknG